MLTVQVIMSEVARARPAVDGNDSVVAGFVGKWLGYLRNLAGKEAYRVRCPHVGRVVTWGCLASMSKL